MTKFKTIIFVKDSETNEIIADYEVIYSNDGSLSSLLSAADQLYSRCQSRVVIDVKVVDCLRISFAI